MALIVNSTEIPQSGAVNFNSTALKQVNHGSVLVWTSTPDPITIMSTGKSIGSWLGGGLYGSDAGYGTYSMSSQGYKNTTNGNIQAHGGIQNGNLWWGGQESTVGSNESRMCSNFTIDTRGFKHIQFTVERDYGDPNSGGAAWSGIGTGGWGSSPAARVNFGGDINNPAGNQWSGVLTLDITKYQGTYRIHLGQFLQGATWKDPYKAWRNNYVKKIYMYA